MAGIAHVITSDSASGAQVIDGSLNFFQESNPYLEFTPGSDGNRSTWTISFWAKVDPATGTTYNPFTLSTSDSYAWEYEGLHYATNNLYYIDYISQASGANILWKTNTKFRDTGWYHIMAVKVNNSTFKLYVNAEEQTSLSSSTNNGGQSSHWNKSGQKMLIGGSPHATGYSSHSPGMSQFYFIDGLALGPEYFGYTDPLTNIWKPKKFKAEGTTYNNGTVWSSGSTVTGGSISNAADGFDGDLSSSGAHCTLTSTDSSTTANVKFAVSFKNVTKVEVFVHSASSSGDTRGTCETINGVTFTSPTLTSASQSFHTIYEGEPIRLKNIGWGINQNGQTGTSSDAFRAFRINGEILIDSTTRNLDFGTNGFYLPMDGNSPIGQDKSGKGNDWTPVNFGGSLELDKATGARPILNTTQGGTQATVGVFGSRQNVGYAVTYYDDGGGNKYYIDGVKQATLNGLIRGATYTFDTVALGSTHPFRLSATSAHGTEYTNGVAAITGAATTITIPHDAPESLYYYCTAHSGMGSSITGITTNEKLADQYASNCVLAMPLIADKEDVSASIACTSTTKTITSNGSPAASSSSSNFYSGSFLFDGTDDCLTSSSCGSGATEYTMECWFNTDGFSQAQRPINMSQDLGGNRYLYAEVRTDKKLQIREESTGSAVSANAVFAADKWQHVAVSYDGVRLRGFVDGVFVVQTSANGSPVPLGTDMKMRVGADESNTGSNEFDGHIQDVRVYFGACKYTATNIGEQAFVVPATSPDILPDTPSGVSGSSKLTKITDGAVSFDGTNDSLSVADHADFTFGSGDFTMEAFVYNKSSSYRSIVMKYGGSPAASSWFWSMYNGQNQFYYYSGSNEPAVTSGKTHYNKWVHCAVSREGNTIRIFDDGELTGTLDVSSYATMNDSTVPLDIGADYADNYDMDGFISNVRIVKGTALYTKSFTPPSAPLTNVTNTKLLCCQSNTSATAAAVTPGTITAIGNAAASNFNPFTTDINAVRGQETGYPTLNPLIKDVGTLSEGNLKISATTTSWVQATSTIGVSSGKWYWEVLFEGTNTEFGVTSNPNSGSYLGEVTGSYGRDQGGGAYKNGSSSSGYTSFSSGSTIGVALDMDNGTVRLYPNGVAEAFLADDLDTSSTFYAGCSVYGSTSKNTINFGQKPFKFSPPDGFQPLNAANLRPETVIARPDQFVGIVTYTGDNSASKKIDDLSFSPDLVWVKDRNLNFTHFLNDTVRGAGKILQSNATTAETDNSDTIAAFPSFDPKGFTVGTNSNWQMNGNNEPYVGWCWKAGGSKNTFNIDDVGYANASDVNMAVGDLNSSFYNTSETWSNGLSALSGSLTNPSNGFNGVLDSYADSTAGFTLDLSGHTFGTGAHTIEVKSGGATSFSVGGASGSGSLTDPGGGGAKVWTGTYTGEINSITSSASGASVYYVKIDGKILVNSGTNLSGLTQYPSIAATGASVGTKQGFSIIKYTGTLTGTPGSGSMPTVPHGLQKKPSFVIAKATVKDASHDGGDWFVWHHSTNLDFSLDLNLGAAGNAISSQGGGTMVAPTTSVFSTPYLSGINAGTGSTYIAYFWHDVPGLQKFGTYSGNSNADGPFIELGFRPALFVMKQTDSTGYWMVYDSARDPINDGSPNYLFWNAASVEGSGYDLDFLSNGVKLRTNNANFNTTSYVYMAWAEAPTIDLYGGGANAR